MSSDGKQRYEKMDIHTCESCGGTFQEGHEVICLSDGYVEIGREYDIENRRFWHLKCWLNSPYIDREGGVDNAE